MLVLARTENQRIRIGSDITVTVVEMAGKTVRLGIEAPAAVMILREELLENVDEALRDAESV